MICILWRKPLSNQLGWALGVVHEDGQKEILEWYKDFAEAKQRRIELNSSIWWYGELQNGSQ